MASIEGVHEGEKPAEPEELTELATSTEAWLDKHGTPITDTSIVVDQYKDLPVIEYGGGSPRLEHTVSEDAVRTVDTEAANALDLRGPLTLTFFQPHYEPNGNRDLALVESLIGFKIGRQAELHDGDLDENLYIDSYQEGEAASDKIRPDTLVPPPGIESEATQSMGRDEIMMSGMRRLMSAIQANNLGRDTSLSLMTKREREALMKIVDKLDVIKELDDTRTQLAG